MTRRSTWCELCKAAIPHDAPNDSVLEGIAAAQEHFRVYHPDTYERLARWPDGSPVVVDESLEPAEFKEGSV